MTDVRYVETDLPPIMVGLPVHVNYDGSGCSAAIVIEMLYGGEVRVELFAAPGRVRPWRDQAVRFEPGGMTMGTFHRLLECPNLARSAMAGTWPPRPAMAR